VTKGSEPFPVPHSSSVTRDRIGPDAAFLCSVSSRLRPIATQEFPGVDIGRDDQQRGDDPILGVSNDGKLSRTRLNPVAVKLLAFGIVMPRMRLSEPSWPSRAITQSPVRRLMITRTFPLRTVDRGGAFGNNLGTTGTSTAVHQTGHRGS
jgi:hypothetical protein